MIFSANVFFFFFFESNKKTEISVVFSIKGKTEVLCPNNDDLRLAECLVSMYNKPCSQSINVVKLKETAKRRKA